jgi:hypothetical protein
MSASVFDFQRLDEICSNLCNPEQWPVEGADKLLSKNAILRELSVLGSSHGATDLPLPRHTLSYDASPFSL